MFVSLISFFVPCTLQSAAFLAVSNMAKGSELTIEQRARIVCLRESGKGVADIAISMSCSKGTVSKTLKRARDHNTLVSLPRTGRPKKTTESDKRFLVLNSRRFRRKTVPVLTEEFNQSRTKADRISNTTTRNILNQADMCGRVAVNKPFLRKINMKKRLKFAKKHVNWTKNRWRRVLFTDESRYEFQCLSDVPRKSRTTVRRQKHEKYSSQCLIPTVKHGGGAVNVWGGICTRGTTPLKLINGIMKAEDYRQILIHHAIPGGKKLLGDGFVFQQDNDPKHTANIVKNYLQRKESDGECFFSTFHPSFLTRYSFHSKFVSC